MWESVSISSGSMWMNFDEVQQAVQPPHGTSDPFSPRIAPCVSITHDEKSPAGKGRSSSILGVGHRSPLSTQRRRALASGMHEGQSGRSEWYDGLAIGR